MKLPIDQIKPNPNNPRIIKDDKFKKLVESIKEFPEMADAREVILNKDHVILGGNMRFRAMKEAGWKEIPVKIVDWSIEKQEQFIVKDNVSGGEWDWDILANEWDSDLLEKWGVDLPTAWQTEDTPAAEADPDAPKLFASVIVAYESIEDLDKITSLYELESVDMTEDIRSQISSQRKFYVFKQ